MGRAKAEQPKLLARKVKEIRLKLGFTQEEMARALEKQGVKIYRGYVGLYEIGERMPPVLIILAYAKVAGISTDQLIDDRLEL
jgi:transcriptional regulator with XRE-family HTH domain